MSLVELTYLFLASLQRALVELLAELVRANERHVCSHDVFDEREAARGGISCSEERALSVYLRSLWCGLLLRGRTTHESFAAFLEYFLLLFLAQTHRVIFPLLQWVRRLDYRH